MAIKRALFTTVPCSHISLVNQMPARRIEPRQLETVDECILVANNESFLSGRFPPQLGLRFLGENLPSSDILEYPQWSEYEEALRSGYDVVGISFYSTSFYTAEKMAAMAREAGVGEVWAGNYGAMTPGAEGVFDRVFIGYPERELSRILEDRKHERIRHPLMTTPMHFMPEGEEAGYLFTIRGCRYACRFCASTEFSRGMDRIDLEEIERVLRRYREMGIRYILVSDETFLQERDHSREVIRLLNKNEMRWWCTTRGDLLLGKVKELKEKGLHSAYIGVESVRDKNLEHQNKGESSAKVVRVLDELKENGIAAAGTYILGLPDDTAQTIEEDLEILNRLPLFITIFLVYTPYPGVEAYREYKRRGLLTSHDWREYDGGHLVFRHPHMSKEEVRRMFEYAITNVYNPRCYNKRRVLKRLDELVASGARNPKVPGAGTSWAG